MSTNKEISIMADFSMNGIDYEVSRILNLSMISEYRGNSYVVGGDTSADTFPNFVKNYNTGVKWCFCLSHIVSFCGYKCGLSL